MSESDIDTQPIEISDVRALWGGSKLPWPSGPQKAPKGDPKDPDPKPREGSAPEQPRMSPPPNPDPGEGQDLESQVSPSSSSSTAGTHSKSLQSAEQELLIELHDMGERVS